MRRFPVQFTKHDEYVRRHMPESMVGDQDVNFLRSQSFILRLWLEDLGEGSAEWRGKMQSVLSGEVRYFRDWHTLITSLDEMLLKNRQKRTTSQESLKYREMD